LTPRPLARSSGLSVGVEEADTAKIIWRRPRDFIDFQRLERSNSAGSVAQAQNKLVEVFDKGVQANDILQGELGNCWFMCSLAAICEFPMLVDRLFIQQFSKDESSMTNRSSVDGRYEMRFCTSGEWRHIVIDEFFPCKADTGTPIFSRSYGSEIWVLLVEKAYAKLQGSYYNCRLGDPGDGLLDLTGAPCLGYNMADPDLHFDDLWSWDRNDCIMCASTPGTDTFTEGGGGRGGNKTGLVPGHAYTVVQARPLRALPPFLLLLPPPPPPPSLDPPPTHAPPRSDRSGYSSPSRDGCGGGWGQPHGSGCAMGSRVSAPSPHARWSSGWVSAGARHPHREIQGCAGAAGA
jgi:hypothetical protein